MIIVWACVIAISLLIEFFTYELVSIWFAPAALIALIMAPIGVVYWWQIISFVILSVVFVLAFRPILKRTLIKDIIPTNITDANMGKKIRLTEESTDGYSAIEINGVTWTAKIEGGLDLKKGSLVQIYGSLGNKFLVKPVTIDID